MAGHYSVVNQNPSSWSTVAEEKVNHVKWYPPAPTGNKVNQSISCP